MTKTKIAFAGVMGAILMSVGANAATITSVATKGYVDQEVGKVQTTVDNLGDTYVTMQQVADAIGADLANGKIDLSAYQLTADMVTTALADVAAEDQDTKYPSVGAVLDAIDTKISALGLSPEQIESLKELLGADGVAASISALQSDVTALKTQVGTGTVADQIADAISTHTTAADGKYQAQSTADLQIGTTGGKFRDMTVAEKAALASGITEAKVAGYDEAKTTVDGLTGTDGTITKLQTAIDGLNGKDGQPGKIETIETTVSQIETIVGDETNGLVADVKANSDAIAENAAAIADNAADIATNTAAIANKITMPAACASGNQTCVLMVANGTVSWTPVTSPVEDPATGGTTGE